MRLTICHSGRKIKDDCFIIWTFHHSLLDGYSTKQILFNVELEYNKKSSIELDTNFIDFVNWNKQIINNNISDNFWKFQLKDVKQFSLPKYDFKTEKFSLKKNSKIE